MKYILEDLDYIFIRAQLPSGKWDNLSLNELSDKQFLDWAKTRFYIDIKDDPTAKGTSWSKQDKVDFLNDMMARNNGKPVVTMLKREKRDEFKNPEINEVDLEELAKQIREGFTSGRLDSQTESGKSKHIAWELKTNIWID